MSILIVPTDFSPNAEKALDQALLLANQTGDSIELLHVVELDYAESAYYRLQIANESKFAEAKLVNLVLGRIKKLNLPISIKWQVLVHYADNLEASIQERFHQMEARLVVMGTGGASNWADRLLGSLTAALVAKAIVPVLTVPADWVPTPLKKLSFCLTPTQLASFEAEVVKWGDWLGCEIEGFYFTDQPGTAHIGHFPFPLTIVPDPVETPLYEDLVTFSKGKKEEAMVMFVRERSFFEKIFDPSITKKVAERISVPLLALPTGN